MSATPKCAGMSQTGNLVVIDSEKLAGLWEEINATESSIAEIEATTAELIKADGRCLADILAEYAEIDRKIQHPAGAFPSDAELEAQKRHSTHRKPGVICFEMPCGCIEIV